MKTLKTTLLALAALALITPGMATTTAADPCEAAVQNVRDAADASPGRVMNAQIAIAIQNALNACPEDRPDTPEVTQTMAGSHPFDTQFMTKLPGSAESNNCQRGTTYMTNVELHYGILIAGQPIGPILGFGSGPASWDGATHYMNARDNLENGFWGRSDGTGAVYLLEQEIKEAFGNARVGCAEREGRLCWASGYAALRGSSSNFAVVVSGLWKQGLCASL